MKFIEFSRVGETKKIAIRVDDISRFEEAYKSGANCTRIFHATCGVIDVKESMSQVMGMINRADYAQRSASREHMAYSREEAERLAPVRPSIKTSDMVL